MEIKDLTLGQLQALLSMLGGARTIDDYKKAAWYLDKLINK